MSNHLALKQANPEVTITARLHFGRVRKLLAQAILFSLMLFPQSSARADEPLPEISFVATALEASLSAIHSIECEYRVQYFRTNGSASVPSGVDRFTWVESGARKLLTTDVTATGQTNRIWVSFADDRGYHCGFDRTPPFAIVQVSQTPVISELYYLIATIPQLLGRSSYRGEWSLPQVMRESGRVVRVSKVHGASCIEIDSIACPDTPNPEMSLTVWCDLEHGCVPRRLLTAKRGHKSEAALQQKYEGWYLRDIKELMSVKDELLATTHWLPKTMDLIGPDTSHAIVVERAEINHQIPDGRFRPQLSPGVEVVTRDEKGRISSTVFGGPAAVAERQERLIREAEELSRKSLPDDLSPVARASAPNTTSLSWLLAGAGVLFLGLGLMIVRRGQ